MDLHYSQTINHRNILCDSFTTLWIYTILKLMVNLYLTNVGFTTLWIYTILKRTYKCQNQQHGFTTLWIYTILKPTLHKSLSA